MRTRVPAPIAPIASAAPAAALVLFLILVSILVSTGTALAAPFQVAGPLEGVTLRELARTGSITAITHSNTPGAPQRLLLALRDGRVVIWDGSRILPQPLLDIRPLVGTAGEGGLLGLAFHPAFNQNGLFFVHYTNTADDTRLVRYRTLPGNSNRADPASAVVLLAIDQPFSNHNGGQLSFGPDGFLYLGLGDGGAAGDPQCRAQRHESLLGKILRLDVDRSEGGRPYAIPADNPFRNGPFLPEVWAVGLRNPWRFSFDRANGDLWIGDVGQGEREEINREPGFTREGGFNWGWNPMEGTLCFGGGNCPGYVPACHQPPVAEPFLEYGHDGGNCSVTGGFVYRGRAQNFVGTYLFGDFCSGRIWGYWTGIGRSIVRELPERVRLLTTFGEDRDGEIYLGTSDGRLLRLEAALLFDRVGLFDPARSQFHLNAANTAGPAAIRFGFGRARSGWIPLAGDWDGDGRDSVGFYDPRRGLFRLRNALSPGVSDFLFRFGPANAGWLPVAGDWNGDGRDGVGLYDPEASVFHLKNVLARGRADRVVAFGPPGAGWLPVAGQFDFGPGLQQEEVGLYDPAAGVFHLQANGSLGNRFDRFGPPNSGWLPVIGDWNGDGRDGIGLYDPEESRFHIQDFDRPAQDFLFGQANAGWLPIAGAW